MKFIMSEKHLIRAFGLALIQLQAYTQEETPIGKTGDLRRAINVTDTTVFKSKFSGFVYIDPSALRSSDKNYGFYVHGGTGIYRKENPAPIVPLASSGKKALAWGASLGTSASGATMREFVRFSVKGQPANPFFDNTIKNYNDQKALVINAFFEQAIIHNLQFQGGMSEKT